MGGCSFVVCDGVCMCVICVCVCSCEWQWLKSLQSSSCPLDLHSSCPQSLQQQLLPCLQLFLKNLNFSQEEAWQHQLYVQEVIELNEDITIILVLPPADQVCTAPGSTDHFVDQPDFVALPISTFEISELTRGGVSSG